MTLDRSQLVVLAGGGSLALLLGAFAFQYIGGMAPCPMCLWQRWPHAAAVLIAVIALVVPARGLAMLGALAALTSAGIGVFHTGVERGWWSGPSSCTSGDITGMSAEQLMEQILTAPLVQCDQVAWEMFGLSMASWNAVISVGLALVWLLAARTGPVSAA